MELSTKTRSFLDKPPALDSTDLNCLKRDFSKKPPLPLGETSLLLVKGVYEVHLSLGMGANALSSRSTLLGVEHASAIT